jgi:hypothetical protein
MSFPTKNAVRQKKLEERKGAPVKPGSKVMKPIQGVAGPGSRFTQDNWGTSNFMNVPNKTPLNASKSDVFGKQAAQSQGFCLHKAVK